jgi:hypothetical protein
MPPMIHESDAYRSTPIQRGKVADPAADHIQLTLEQVLRPRLWN